ncbi:MAG TPA: bacillithiol biosynthesis deacetylase BshB1 [Candidatus Deferrimicrobium sp.]|nr:bacillithiol biosynthesis deacetylase BshB1 [Candidatus Deferrimicrobium sp.]
MPDLTSNPGTLDVLAVAAHPDDAEITCGGLLIRMAKLGRQTGILDLTRGEMGTSGDSHEREAEAAEATRILGLAYRSNLSLPDSALDLSQANKLLLAAAIRQTRPELIILPHWEQRHPDHVACYRLGYDACFLAGLKKLAIDGEPFRPRKIVYVSYFRNTDYSFLVDISAEFDQKCQAVAAYRSQFANPAAPRQVFHPGVDIFDLMRTRAAALGQPANVKYAEAYTVKEQILIDDPQKMPIASI